MQEGAADMVLMGYPERKSVGMNFVKFDVAFDSLHSDRRFSPLVQRMALPN